MKENVENNEKLLEYLEKNKKAYDHHPETVREVLAEQFGMNRHSLRAWFSRLANPNKYGGKYAERMKPFLRTHGASIKTNTIAETIADHVEKIDDAATITAKELEEFENMELDV